MPSFDVVSEFNWQELTNAVAQSLKEAQSRFDFKGVQSEIEVDRKQNLVTVWCSQDEKLDALKDIFFSKLIKRGISTLSLVEKTAEEAFGGSKRQKLEVQSGVSKEKAKLITTMIKNSRIKVQAQLQDEQVRVTSKSRDDLQSVISLLKEKQAEVGLPLNFTNFRD